LLHFELLHHRPKVRNNLKVHFDWRQRVAGNAQPGSGPAVTLAGDF
jgi:hypothetical protein